LRLRGLRWRRAAPAASLRAAPEVEASVLSSIGVVLSASGRLDEALTHHQRALAIFEEALGPRHPNVALAHGNIGAVLHEQGRLDEASIHHRNALGIYEEALGPRHPELARLLQGLAEVALASHDPDAAREHAERALSMREAGEVPPELLAESRFVLARALWAYHAERSRSRALALQARDGYVALGDAKRGALAEVVAWLAEHRITDPNA
jgi:tetratricopeptide (TPR) repeat protein